MNKQSVKSGFYKFIVKFDNDDKKYLLKNLDKLYSFVENKLTNQGYKKDLDFSKNDVVNYLKDLIKNV
jgi:flagellin-specific chaperone FliS